MALMKCKECGKEISSKAEFCPHCGFVYKKQKAGTKKIVLVTLITLFVVGIILVSGVYLIYDVIPKAKEKRELEKYYGTWVLEEDSYDKLYFLDYDIEDKKVIRDNYKTKKEIVINKDNLKSDAGDWGCGFNTPTNGFAITTWVDTECTDNYYLLTSLNKLVEFDSDDLKEKYNFMMCFDLKDNMLIQKTCKDIISNEGIKYKRK